MEHDDSLMRITSVNSSASVFQKPTAAAFGPPLSEETAALQTLSRYASCNHRYGFCRWLFTCGLTSVGAEV